MSNKGMKDGNKTSRIPTAAIYDFSSIITVLNESLTPDGESKMFLIDTEIERYVMEIIDCVDLADCGNLLLEYVAAAIKSKKYQSYIDQLYRRLNGYRSKAGTGKEYTILDGTDAKNTFLESLLPLRGSLEDSLKSIASVGTRLTNYVQPIGKQLHHSKAEEILDYLNDKHLFTKKVYRDENVRVMLLKNSDKKYNSDSYIQTFNKFMLQDIVIFAMNSKKKELLPEAELFLQLAIGLYSRYSIMVPKRTLYEAHDMLRANYQRFEDNNPIHPETEQYIDALKIGLMVDSPYESLLPTDKTGTRKTRRLKEAAEMMLSSL